MGMRTGVSHFLEVVIMVGLVGVLGMLLYSGALDLFAGWGNIQQLTINSAYKVGKTLNVIVANKGSTPVSIQSLTIYRLNGTQLVTNTSQTNVEPGKVAVFTFSNISVSEGELIDIIVTTSDGSSFKFRVAVQ